MAYRKRPGEPYSSFSSSQSQSRSSASQPSHAYKQARTGYGTARVTSGSSQADPLVLDSDDDDEGDEEVPDATQGYGEAEYQFGLYGVLPTKIVGVRHYRGMATLGEMAIARREPRNPYDSNAIQVINVQGAQIGHIPRGVAGKLARYMDNRSLLLETEITGHKGDFECPIEIKLYGTDDPVQRERLMAQLRNDRLPVGHATDRKRKEERAAKERQKVAAQAAQAARREQKRGGAVVASGQAQVQARSQAQSQAQQSESGLSEFTGGPSQGLGVAPPSLEDIMGASERFNPRNVDQVVEQFGIKEDDLAAMPKAPQPEALLTQLHDFQLQGLQWMLDKENPQLPAAGTRDVVQLWKRHSTVANMFTNLATNFTVANPTLGSGGILADDIGSGKTIQVISLIMADRALGRRAKDICDATLILAPVSVMSNWSTQMKKHIKEEYGLRVMFYHGTRKQPITPQQIQKYDVVISTYDSVSSEWHSQKSTILPRKSGVFSVKWRRVILDGRPQHPAIRKRRRLLL